MSKKELWEIQEEALLGPAPGRTSAAQGLRHAARLISTAVLALLFIWALGRLFSDRFVWSQWIAWLPTVTVVGASWVLVAAAWVVRRVGRAAAAGVPTIGPRDRVFRALFSLSLAGTLAATVFLLLVTLGMTRALRPGPGPDSVKLVFWNAATGEGKGWSVNIAGPQPDICILVGLMNADELPNVRQAMDSRRKPDDPEVSVIRTDLFTVITRAPITRWGFVNLSIGKGEGIDPRYEDNKRNWADPGRALYFELAGVPREQGGFGRPVVVRVIDLPSDLSLSRNFVTSTAVKVMEEFVGPEYRPGSIGQWTAHELERVNGKAPGFPAPDILVGDCNIPRGSYSLRVLSPGMTHAFSQAGEGTAYAATWPRHWPLWHIDQLFTAPSIRVGSYDIIDPGCGSHRAQVAKLEPVDAGVSK